MPVTLTAGAPRRSEGLSWREAGHRVHAPRSRAPAAARTSTRRAIPLRPLRRVNRRPARAAARAYPVRAPRPELSSRAGLRVAEARAAIPRAHRRRLGTGRPRRRLSRRIQHPPTSRGPGKEPAAARPHRPLRSRLGPTVGLTNGTLFTGRRLAAVEILAGSEVALQISLDSADPDVNDEARGVDNFAKVVAAIPALVERGVSVRIATTRETADPADTARLCELHADSACRTPTTWSDQ